MTNTALLYMNSFAVLVLVLTLRNYRQKFKYICCEEKVFIFFILTTMAALVIEAALENLWAQPGQGVHVLLHILQTLDYCLSVIVPLLWLYYCLFRIYHITNIRKRIRILIAVPAALFAVFVVATVLPDVAFAINENNEYVRGLAFPIAFVLGYSYIAAALLLIVIKRKALNQGELFPYLLVPLIPVVLGIVEEVTGGPIFLIWSANTLVILEIQMLILNNKTNIDHLTGLNNRLALDTYVKRMIHESHNMHEPFGLIMIDIDSFKKINDRFGHVEGDRALKTTADILRDCFSGKYFIARYGGDEFTVVIKNCTDAVMDTYLEKLERERIRHNNGVHKPYEIHLSVGASVFSQHEITDVHTMFMQVDEIMYRHKNLKKAQEAEDRR